MKSIFYTEIIYLTLLISIVIQSENIKTTLEVLL